MPRKPSHPCSHPGCPALVHSRHCLAHTPARSHGYDNRRGKVAERGYGGRWQRYVAQYKKQHPLCINHATCGSRTAVVDHILAVNQGGDFWDPNNHQPMCRSCHGRKTAQEDAGFGNPSRLSDRGGRVESRQAQRPDRAVQQSKHDVSSGIRGSSNA